MTAADKEWFDQLASQLADIDLVFGVLNDVWEGRSPYTQEEEEALGARQDGADLPHQYARAMERILKALHERPEFADNRGMQTLRALFQDLQAIDEGSHPFRLTPVSREDRAQRLSPARRWVQGEVILCLRFLEEIGMSGNSARNIVAESFADGGVKGARGGRLSPDTVTRWREMVLAPDGIYLPQRRRIQDKLAEWQSDPRWPPAKEEALAFVRHKASRPSISLAPSK